MENMFGHADKPLRGKSSENLSTLLSTSQQDSPLAKRKKTKEEEEEDLIEQVKRGDPNATKELYLRNFRDVYEYVDFKLYHLLRHHVEEKVKDATQQTFIRGFNKIHRYKSRGVPFKAYLFTIAGFVVKEDYRDWLTKESHQDHLEALPDYANRFEDKRVDVLAEVLKSEQRRQVWQLIDELPFESQYLIYLRFQKDLPFKEIALLLNQKEPQTKMQMTRLLRKLRNLCTAKGIIYE